MMSLGFRAVLASTGDDHPAKPPSYAAVAALTDVPASTLWHWA